MQTNIAEIKAATLANLETNLKDARAFVESHKDAIIVCQQKDFLPARMCADGRIRLVGGQIYYTNNQKIAQTIAARLTEEFYKLPSSTLSDAWTTLSAAIWIDAFAGSIVNLKAIVSGLDS